jgi:hypothetical protein
VAIAAGECTKLHKAELNDLYSSRKIVRVIKSRRMGWAGHVARMEEGRGVHKVLGGVNQRDRDHWRDQGVGGRIILRWIFRKWEGVVGKPEGKRPLERPRRRWEDNIKMDLQEVGRVCGETRGKETIGETKA